MLHRVLPRSGILDQGANPEWTLSEPVFANFLEFLLKHYNLISLSDLNHAEGNVKMLPPRAALITFDDGWRDNHLYALPHLMRLRIPAHVFIATDWINSKKAFWQEQLYTALANDVEKLTAFVSETDYPGNVASFDALVEWLNDREPVESSYSHSFSCLQENLPKDRQMISDDEIVELVRAGISVGSHGASHQRLTNFSVDDLQYEIESSIKRLSDLTGESVESLSFPHGAFNDSTMSYCKQAGIRFIFNSVDGIIRSNTHLYGRVHVAEHALVSNGIFTEYVAAFNLFFRKHL